MPKFSGKRSDHRTWSQLLASYLTFKRKEHLLKPRPAIDETKADEEMHVRIAEYDRDNRELFHEILLSIDSDQTAGSTLLETIRADFCDTEEMEEGETNEDGHALLRWLRGWAVPKSDVEIEDIKAKIKVIKIYPTDSTEAIERKANDMRKLYLRLPADERTIAGGLGLHRIHLQT